MLGSECGYTPKEIGAMTLRDVSRITEHWQRHPPLRWLVGACALALGVKLPDQNSVKPKYLTPDEMREYARLANSVGIGRM